MKRRFWQFIVILYEFKSNQKFNQILAIGWLCQMTSFVARVITRESFSKQVFKTNKIIEKTTKSKFSFFCSPFLTNTFWKIQKALWALNQYSSHTVTYDHHWPSKFHNSCKVRDEKQKPFKALTVCSLYLCFIFLVTKLI